MRALALTITLTAIAATAQAGVGTPRLPQSKSPTLAPGDFAWPAPFDDCVDRWNDPRSCAPIVACVGDELWFSGRAIGRGHGILSGFLSDSATCSGTWMSRNAFGLGQADVSCDNGLSARVFFTYQDSRTGTATGAGIATDLRRIKVWSGHNIRQFLSESSGQVNPKLMCGDQEIPIS